MDRRQFLARSSAVALGVPIVLDNAVRTALHELSRLPGFVPDPGSDRAFAEIRWSFPGMSIYLQDGTLVAELASATLSLLRQEPPGPDAVSARLFSGSFLTFGWAAREVEVDIALQDRNGASLGGWAIRDVQISCAEPRTISTEFGAIDLLDPSIMDRVERVYLSVGGGWWTSCEPVRES